MSGISKRASRRALAVIPVVALVAATLAATGAVGAATASPQFEPPIISDSEYYMNYVEPRAEAAFGTDMTVSQDAVEAQEQQAALVKADALERKFTPGQPGGGDGLAKLEAKSIKTGKSPKWLKHRTSRRRRRRPPSCSRSWSSSTRTRTTTSPASRCRRRFGADRRASRATCRTDRCTTTSPTRPTLRAAGQQLDVGARLLARALQQDALHRRRASPSGSARTSPAPTASRASTSPATP